MQDGNMAAASKTEKDPEVYLAENTASAFDNKTYDAALTTAEQDFIENLDSVEKDRIFRKVCFLQTAITWKH